MDEQTFDIVAESGALIVTTPKAPEVVTYTAEQIAQGIIDAEILKTNAETQIAFWQDLESKRVALLPENQG